MLDVTCGSGAFMKDLSQAIKLAETMKRIGELAQKETICVITSMEEPLGETVGNSLEIEETVRALQGNMKEDVKEVVLTLGAYMMKLAGKGNDIEGNKQKMLMQIRNGEAFKKLKELIQEQGGDIAYIENIELLPKAKYVMPVLATQGGYIKTLDARNVGEISMHLGAGRMKKEDNIDPTVGVVLKKKIGDKVAESEVLAYVHTNSEKKGQEAVKRLLDCYQIVEEKVEKESCILKVV